jgi:hypothetical protein
MSDFRAIGDAELLRFHRSLYLSLALSCACLAYTEWPFLPQVLGLAFVVAIFLVVAYRLEGRWSLSLRAANMVGGVIAVLIFAWIAFQITNPAGSILRLLPWPSSLLPYLGPLVMVVIPAKLFRPKHVGDYWGLQFAGLMGVCLACALGGDATICVLVLAYALAAACCLANFCAVAGRVQQPRRIQPGQSLGPAWTSTVSTALIAITLSVGMSWAVPRITDTTWEYGSIANRLRTGINDERPAIDLNVSGELSVSEEEAFAVQVVNALGQPKLDLSPSQRWRATSFNYYDRGKWQNRNWASFRDQRRMGRMVVPNPGPIAPFVRLRAPRPGESRVELPQLGAQQFTVTFPYPTKMLQAFYVADPVWAPLEEHEGRVFRAPLESISERGQPQPWVAQPEGDVFPPVVSHLPEHPTYRQVVAPLPEQDVGLPVFIDPAFTQHLTVVNQLPRLREFSNDLLQAMIADGRITWSGESPRAGGKAPPEKHEAIARAFDEYFRISGDFQYSYTLDRNDSELDPVEDFVVNLRRGHCNRFASALALLLRCQGIPTRIVMGFHGAESQNNGTYVIRQSFAHSWVEAVIRRPAENGNFSQHWLTLDPTPESPTSGSSEGGLAHVFDSFRSIAWAFVRNYLIEYHSERQREMGNWLLTIDPREWSTTKLITLVFVSMVALVIVPILWLIIRGRRLGRQRTLNDYGRLVELIRRSGLLTPQASWTPNELFGRLANSCPSAAAVSAARRIVNEHYLVRFGGTTLHSADAADLAIVRSHLAGRPRHSDPD